MSSTVPPYSKVVVSLSRRVKSDVTKLLRCNDTYGYCELGGSLSEVALSEDSYTSSLSKIEYGKSMFRPGYVFLTLSVTSSQNPAPSKTLQTAVKESFFDKITFMDLVGVADGAQAGSCSKSDIVYLARNYYVQGYEVTSISSLKHDVILRCYSPDRKLTLSEYSRVYTGKTLSDSILRTWVNDNLDAFKKIMADIVTKEAGTAADIDDREGIYKSADRICNINFQNLLLTGYQLVKKGSKVTSAYRTKNANNTELKHPYLVQYNESFYDFVSRVAHKCGEFFYYENGRITFGLPLSTRERIYPKGTDESYTYKDIYTDSKGLSHLCSFSSVMKEETVSSLSKEVISFSSDYANKPDAVTPDGKTKYYSTSSTSDEALHVVKEEDNAYGIKGGPLLGDWLLYKTLGTYFRGETFWSGLGNAVGYLFWDLLYMGAILPGTVLGPDYKKKHINDGKDTKEVNDLGQENAAVGDMGADNIANLCNAFFHEVEGWEKTAAETLVDVNLESTLRKVHLGDCVTLDNIDGKPLCVVVSMHGEYSSSKTSNSFEAVPVIKLDKKSGSLTSVAVPVGGQVEHIRRVSPMEAVVADCDDPLRLGRVRVTYPWQSNTGDMSPWLRVEVPFAGGTDDNNPGFCMTPSKGEHVMLNYVDGNIEYPFVSGSLYYLGAKGKGNHIPPTGDTDCEGKYFKTDHQIRTIASGKGHALVFQDFANTSLITHALPFFGTLWQFFRKVTGKSTTLDALPIQGGSVTLRDGTGITTICLSPNSREITLNSSLGSVTMNAFTGITINAPNGDITIKGKNISLEAGNNISIQSGKNLGNIRKSLADTLPNIAGQVAAKAIVGGIKETGINIGNFFDLSFLRAALETILRPVEGTLNLRSKRHVVMTAGKGDVAIPDDQLSKAKTWDFSKEGRLGGLTDFNIRTDNVEVGKVRDFLESCMLAVNDFYNGLKNDLVALVGNIYSAYELLNTEENQLLEIDRSYMPVGFLDRLNTCRKVYDYSKNFQAKNPGDLFPNVPQQVEEQVDANSSLRRASFLESFNTAFINLKNAYEAVNGKNTYAYFVRNNVLADAEGKPVKKLAGCGDNTISKIKAAVSTDFSGLGDSFFADDFIDSVCQNNALLPEVQIIYQIKLQKIKVKKYIAVQTLLNFDKVAIVAEGEMDDWAKQTSKIRTVHDSFDTDLQDIVNGVGSMASIASMLKPADASQQIWWKQFGLGIAKVFGNPQSSFPALANVNGVSGPRSWSNVSGGSGDIFLSTASGTCLRYTSGGNNLNHEDNVSSIDALKNYLTGVN